MQSLMLNGKKHEKGKCTYRLSKHGKRIGQMFGWMFARRDEIQRHNEEVRQNREILKTVTETVLYLSKQELAFRGLDESE